MATAAQARLVSGARAWLALLPARIDDRRFWLRAALGLALRALALLGSWWPLRAALAWAVGRTLALGGATVALADRATLLVGSTRVETTVTCTHVEVLALLAPLLWDRSKNLGRNFGLLALGAVAAFVIAVARVDLAVGLLTLGVPWLWGHDVLLGVCYFAVVAATLHHGAWMGRPGRARPTAA